MNRLLMNKSVRNHIRFLPMPETIPDLPADEGDRIRWCEAEFARLQSSEDAKRLICHANRRKGYMITVWELDGMGYLCQCLRTNTGVYVSTIYVSKDLDDLVAIAKFLRDNVETAMADYKKQILEARDWLAQQPTDAPVPTEANHDA